MKKIYEKVICHIKQGILDREMRPGYKLLPERELAEELETSRNSVREGLRVLENMGVLSSHQGSGNYISSNFDETITEVMAFMYVLKDMDVDSITEFRFSLEWQAVNLAVKRITCEQKAKLTEHLRRMEEAESEAERVEHDKAIHYQLIEATGNDYMITNYRALTNVMDQYIPWMRVKIIEGMKNHHSLGKAHRILVEGVVEGDLQKGLRGLDLHFGYINQYKDT